MEGAMSLLDEVLFSRLLDRYEHRFGAPPPIQKTTLPEAIDHMRRALAQPETPPMHMPAGTLPKPMAGMEGGWRGGA